MSEENIERTESTKQWYVVNTYAGHENRVKENLEKRIESMGITDYLFKVVVAEEKQIEIKNGKPKEVIKNIFPGYLFVEMIMNEEAWYIVRNTPGVTGFLGSHGGGAWPIPVRDSEMQDVLRRIGQSDVAIEADFKVGDVVKVLSGPFVGMEGVVDSMNDETMVATVLIILFGRETPTDINYVDIALAD